MKRIAAIALVIGLAAFVAGCGGGKSSSSSSSSSTAPKGHVNIVVWHGYTDAEATAINKLAAEFNRTHPNITVTPHFNGSNDFALQKVLTAIAGGKPPDLAYLYGSWAANIAKSPKTVDLNQFVKKDPSFNLNDFYPAERNAATVNGKLVGLPALVDNLALVYNKKMFDKAGLAYPTANWTWADFENAALKLTNPDKKQFGWAYVADASEDTVWRYWALLWQAGGAILTPDGKKAAFDSPAGLKALSMIQALAQKHAIYLDNGNQNYLGLFNSGHIGMLYTGPWDLSQIREGGAPYGVQILPADQNHQTISGPDNWVMFDNGDARKQARMGVPQLADVTADRPPVGADDGRPADAPVGDEAAGLQAVPRQVPGRRRVGGQPGQRHPGAAGDDRLPEDLERDRTDGAGSAAGQGPAPAGAAARPPSRWTASSRCRARGCHGSGERSALSIWPDGRSSRLPSS